MASLRLFLSADLAGSTAYKQSIASAYEWQRLFRGFYRQLPAFVDKQFSLDESRILLWKTIGDEIVFSSRLTSSQDVPRMVAAFRKAVAEYRGLLKNDADGLDIKCAGWTAGFPVGNLEVQLPGKSDEFDYVGPGMDIGFRLVKAATPRRFMLSVELAYILTLSGFENPRICFGRSLALKGVGKGHRYPHLWMDSYSSSKGEKWDRLELEEESLRGSINHVADQSKANSYCLKWLEAIGEPFIRPFIDGDSKLGERPTKYDQLLEELSIQSQQLNPETPEERKEAQEGEENVTLQDFTPILRTSSAGDLPAN